MTNIKIDGVYVGSEKQVEKGILGTVNLSVLDADNNIVAQLNGLMVRNNRDKTMRFLAAPSYKMGGRDGEEAKYRNHFRLFPLADGQDEAQQKERMSALVTEVLTILDNGGTPKRDRTGTSSEAPKAKQAW